MSTAIRITDFAATRVAVLTHCGAPELLDASVERFRAWRRSSGQSPPDRYRTFGMPYGDPQRTPPAEFRFDLCGELGDEPLRPNDLGIFESLLQPGRCAVLRHAGPTDRIGESVYAALRDWLPTSGYQVAAHPLLFHYLSVYPDTPLQDWQTDIYIPLR